MHTSRYLVFPLCLTLSLSLTGCFGSSSSSTETDTLSDELMASFDALSPNRDSDFEVEREMGFPGEETYLCDADGVIAIQSEGDRRFCIVLKDDAEYARAPAVSPDGVDFYLELAVENQTDLEAALSDIQSGHYEGESLSFTPVLLERIEQTVEIGSLVDLTFHVAQAGYGSCDIYDEADEWVTSIDALSQDGDQLSGSLPANLPVGNYSADCLFTNSHGTFPGDSDDAEGVPSAASIEITSGSGDEPDLDTIYFEPDSSTLQPDDRSLLMDEYADYLSNNPDVTVRLEGHADVEETDSRGASMDLAERRANSVRDFLVLHDIDSHRIDTVPYGEERPVSEGTSDSELALNRRVEILLQQ